jgi:ribosomal protein L11 methyltransferase
MHDLVVEIRTSTAEAELVADRLWQAGATALGLDEQGDATTLTASFPTNDAARTVSTEFPGARLVEIDPAWRDEWKQYAEPFDIGERLRVTPAWRDLPVPRARTTIRIDPGYAFGSGSHASTRMILAHLDRTPPVDLTVLDLGCGSGILSVAAAVLGARQVEAVDIDPDAVEATRRNAEANGVADRIAVVDAPCGPYDLTVVNVTAAVHAEVGPTATGATSPGGTLVIAGLLPGQWRHVAGAYEGAEVVAELDLDGWEGRRLERRE